MNLKCVIRFATVCGFLLASAGCWSIGYLPVEKPLQPLPRPAFPVKERTALDAGGEIVTLSFEDWQVPEGLDPLPSQYQLRKVPFAVAVWINDGLVSDELSFAFSGASSIDVPRAGRYWFTLRILPAGSNLQVRLRQGRAYINCGNIAAEKKIEPGVSFIEFVLELDSGPQNLQAYFTNQLPNRRTVGAFYVDVQYIGS